MKLWRLLLAIGLTALCVVACQGLLGLESPHRKDDLVVPEPDASFPLDAATDAAPDPCEAGPDLPPATGQDDDPTVELPTQIFLIHKFRFEADGGVAGFNLDHDCTCSGAGVAPCVPRSKNTDALCDADGGVDNALGLSTRSTLFEAKNSDAFVDDGSRSILLALSGYNGLSNDKAVRVSLGRSVGLYSDIGCNGLPRGRSAEGSQASGTKEQEGDPAREPSSRHGMVATNGMSAKTRAT